MFSNGETRKGIEKTIAADDDTDRREFYRLCGISAIILGISYIIITMLYVLVGAPPKEGEAFLQYLDGNTTIWWAILFLSVLTDMLFLPIALSLYLVLKRVNKNVVMAGAGLVALFAILDMAVTWPNYASLITLSGDYALATTDVQRAAYVAAATFASSVLTSHLFAVYAILVPAIGILLTSLVMLKGTQFSKITAYVGVVTGILGFISVVGPFFVESLGFMAVPTSVFTTIWVLLVGYKLLKL
jgi:hypothetical protein